MILRRATMLAYISEMKFRRIRGYRELRHLENILKNKLEKKEVAA